MSAWQETVRGAVVMESALKKHADLGSDPT